MASCEFNMRLIEAVKPHPIIFDLRSNEHKDAAKRQLAWEHIAIKLNEDADVLKRKWRNMRDSYAKHLRSLQGLIVAKDANRYQNWQWANHMEFFKPYMAPGRSRTDAPDECFESTDGASSSPSSVVPVEYSPCTFPDPAPGFEPTIVACHGDASGRRKRKMELIEEDPLSKTFSYPEFMSASNSEMDAVDYLFLSYAKTFKTFSARRQVLTKVKLAELMGEQELEELNEWEVEKKFTP